MFFCGLCGICFGAGGELVGGWHDPREIKYHLSTLAGVVIPALQALVSGLAVGVILGSLAYIFGVSHFLAVGLLSAGLGGGVAWLIALSFWRSRVYRSAPPKLPGVMGSGEVLRLAVTVDSDVDSSFAGVWADLPINREKLLLVAKQVVKDSNFTYANLSGRHRPLSRAEFEAVRSELLKRQLLYQKSRPGENLRVGVTRVGMASFQRLAQMETSPTPRSPRGRHKLPDRRVDTNTNMHKTDQDTLDDLWN